MIFDNYSQNTSPTGEMGKDEFLQMLVAQLRHQDPLSPMESQDFAAQLAQFSSLEELSSIDDSVSEGVDVDMILTQAINNTLATTLIGKQVIAYGNSIEFKEGSPADLSFRLSDLAEEIDITIYGEDGSVVRTITVNSLAQGEHTFPWDGENDQGEQMPDGSYTFGVSARDKDGNIVEASTISRGYVSSVKYENGIAILMVNGREIKFSDVLEIG
jgi:flagellar basal-body rod modification protein FlgD